MALAASRAFGAESDSYMAQLAEASHSALDGIDGLSASHGDTRRSLSLGTALKQPVREGAPLAASAWVLL